MSLSEVEKKRLDEFVEASHGRHFSFRDPKTRAFVYAAFLRFPFNQSQQAVVGSHSTYDVQIVLRDTTELIEEALEQGVAVHPSRS